MAIKKQLVTAIAGVTLVAGSSMAVSATDIEDLRERANQLMGSVEATPIEEIENPVAQLGQALFWDIRLSSNGEVACASCHFRENYGSDSRQRSINARGSETLQSQTVFHSQDTPGLRWLADRESGKAQAMGSITGSMGFDNRTDILPVLEEHGYEELFAAAFPNDPDPVSVDNYGEALEFYQRTLRTPAPFDAWLKGDDGAMDELQVRGLERFMTSGCVGCHSGELVGGTMLQRFGVMENYWEHTGSPQIMSGLMDQTGEEDDRFFFRVPLLRNVAETGPYFHDGSVNTLRRATAVMARVQLGQDLDSEALDELVAFQEALTGEIPENFMPPEGIPFELPEGVEAD